MKTLVIAGKLCIVFTGQRPRRIDADEPVRLGTGNGSAVEIVVLGCSKKENGALEGNKYIVTWALGHLVTLKDPEDYDKKYKEWNMAVLPMMPEKLQIKVIPQTGKQYHAVTTQLARKDVNEIVIATDAGREGELVARWILDKAHNQKPCKRLWISSVTDKAIREGFANLKDAKEYDNLYRAAARFFIFPGVDHTARRGRHRVIRFRDKFTDFLLALCDHGKCRRLHTAAGKMKNRAAQESPIRKRQSRSQRRQNGIRLSYRT